MWLVGLLVVGIVVFTVAVVALPVRGDPERPTSRRERSEDTGR